MKQATLYLRDSVPAVARTEQHIAVGRLQALEAAGAIDKFTVESWPNRITDGAPETEPALAAYERFIRWAHSHHATMHPGFDSHECHSLYTGMRFRTTVFPMMCLALFEDDELTTVYPHAREGRPMSVNDGLAILETDRQPAVIHRTRPSGRKEPQAP